MDLSIIIVNYKTKDKTLRSLEAISKSDLSGVTREIIVVDNNSGDELERPIKEQYPYVKFIQTGENLGMGEGNNVGIKASKGEYIMVLNPDVYVEPDSIKKLYLYIKNRKDVGIVAPKLLNSDGSLQCSCFRDYKLLTPLYRRTFLGNFKKNHLDNFVMKDYDRKQVKEVDWIMGSCFVVRKDVINKVGGFSQRYFMYFEDTDLCKKIRKENFKVIYNPDIQVIHDHARDSAKEPWLLAPFTDKLAREHIKSWIKYFLKWGRR